MAKGYIGTSPTAFKYGKGWDEKLDMTMENLTKAAKKLKKWANEKREPRAF